MTKEMSPLYAKHFLVGLKKESMMEALSKLYKAPSEKEKVKCEQGRMRASSGSFAVK